MLPEFLEALSRTIDRASPIPPNENKEEWPMEKRQGQLLINKLENVLPLLIKLIKGAEFKNLKEKFPMPLKDLITGLYVPNFENQFYLGYVIKPGVKKGNMRGRASISDGAGRRRSTRLRSNEIIKLRNETNENMEEKPKENQEEQNLNLNKIEEVDEKTIEKKE